MCFFVVLFFSNAIMVFIGCWVVFIGKVFNYEKKRDEMNAELLESSNPEA